MLPKFSFSSESLIPWVLEVVPEDAPQLSILLGKLLYKYLCCPRSCSFLEKSVSYERQRKCLKAWVSYSSSEQERSSQLQIFLGGSAELSLALLKQMALPNLALFSTLSSYKY